MKFNYGSFLEFSFSQQMLHEIGWIGGNLIENSTNPLKISNQRNKEQKNSKINQFHEKCQRDVEKFGKNSDVVKKYIFTQKRT
jgi:hypothetical protein